MARTRLVLILAGALAGAAVLIGAASAGEGGATIATAPLLVWGELQSGTGGNNFAATQPAGDGGSTFWKVTVHVGDRITGVGHVATQNGCALNRVELYGPEVTDANIWQSKKLSGSGGLFQGSCNSAGRFAWRWDDLPITGTATLWMRIGSEAPTFTFKAYVFHRTEITIARIAQPVGGAVTVHARITSTVGTPTGICTFLQRTDDGAWTRAARIPAAHGSCVAHITNSAKSTVRIRVQFSSEDDYLASTAYTHLLEVQ